MRKTFLLMLLLWQIVIFPSYKGTDDIDYTKPGLAIDERDGEAYYTYPGTRSRDYRKPSYIIQRTRKDRPYERIYNPYITDTDSDD